MNMISRSTVAAAFALALMGGAAAQASVIYSDGATDSTGQYRSDETVAVGFSATAGSADISFDLFGAKSLDGYGNGYDDLFTVVLNGVTVFEGYFDMGGGGSTNILTNTLGWAVSTTSYGLWNGGLTTISGMADLLAGNNDFSVTFSSPLGGNQGTGDESWALNNLDVTSLVAPVPLPASLPLLGLGLAGLGLMGRKKARKSV